MDNKKLLKIDTFPFNLIPIQEKYTIRKIYSSPVLVCDKNKFNNIINDILKNTDNNIIDKKLQMKININYINEIIKICNIDIKNITLIKQLYINIKQYDYDIDIIECSKIIPKDKLLLFFGIVIFNITNFKEDNNLILFLKHVLTRYHNHPFHNIEHAIDVFYSTYYFQSKTCNNLTDNQKFIMLIVSILHDIEHIGVSNVFIKNTKHKLWKDYDYVNSPLEAMHLKYTLSVLNNETFGIFKHISNEEKNELIEFVKKLINATDLSLQKKLIEQFDNIYNETDLIKQQHIIGSITLHLADLGATAKKISIHKKWVVRINMELFNEYSLFKINHTDSEQTINNNIIFHKIAKSQIDFLNILVIPVFNKINDFYDLSEQISNLQNNLLTWKLYLPTN